MFGCAVEEPDEEAVVVVAFDEPMPTVQPDGDVEPNVVPDVPDEPDNPDDPTVVEPSTEPNLGWIGGACSAAGDCDYDAGVCLTNGQPGGLCSLGCDGLCPDRDGENSPTFCINSDGLGRCVSECDTDLYTFNGCREGYQCQRRRQFGDDMTSAAVCVPNGTPREPDPEPEPEVPCLDQLDALGVDYHAWSYSTQTTDGLSCTIDDPIYVASPINGVNYRYYSDSSPDEIAVACDLALALYRLGDVLKQRNIVEVEHIGTFNCRKIGGTNSLSMHGLGLAIDFYGFVDANGTDYVLERDWEHDTDSPSTVKGRMLYDLALEMFNERVFNFILTPNYNAAHDNHFHVDLTPGGLFIGASYSAYDIGDDCGN